MKAVLVSACALAAMLAVGSAFAELPTATIHVLTASKSELVVHPGDLIQLEHTYLLIQSPPKDAVAITTDPKHVALVKTLRVVNGKVLGSERATIASLFKAELPGRAVINLEIVEKNGKRKIITCQVDVR